MRNFKLAVFALLTTVFGVSNASFADKSDCPWDAVHCAYMTGLSDSLSDGRYIKLIHNSLPVGPVCFNGTGVAFIDQWSAEKYVGENSDHYFICSDSSGTNCEPIGVDGFKISPGADGYVSKPKYYSIDVSIEKDRFPSCDSVESSLKR